jgi:hypothetical protein
MGLLDVGGLNLVPARAREELLWDVELRMVSDCMAQWGLKLSLRISQVRTF